MENTGVFYPELAGKRELYQFSSDGKKLHRVATIKVDDSAGRLIYTPNLICWRRFLLPQ
jgi:hypothetical protein